MTSKAMVTKMGLLERGVDTCLSCLTCGRVNDSSQWMLVKATALPTIAEKYAIFFRDARKPVPAAISPCTCQPIASSRWSGVGIGRRRRVAAHVGSPCKIPSAVTVSIQDLKGDRVREKVLGLPLFVRVH